MNTKGNEIVICENGLGIRPLDGSEPYFLSKGSRVRIHDRFRRGGNEGIVTGIRKDSFPPYLPTTILVRIDGTRKAIRYNLCEFEPLERLSNARV
ncbi:MAG: hypothetical protein HON27_03955 [Candidatus Marinimicrobia bacterium]|jgi:hypothetical protein|nr:hypothetical protein [Candidatus Neomarinimicrobiota bacterium]